MRSDTKADNILRRRGALLVISALLLAGCSSQGSSTPAKTTIPHADHVHAKRYCEVLLVVPGSTGGAQAKVYNSFPMTDCPESKWSALDTKAIAAENQAPLAILNGPRYWAMDSISKVWVGKKITRVFGGIPMDEEAVVNVGDLAAAKTPYVPHVVDRKATFAFSKGSTVYELSAPDGSRYVMQSWSQQVDPTLSEADLASLGSKLTLPSGWSYASRKLGSPLVVQTTGKVAHVLMDDLGDSYSLEATG